MEEENQLSFSEVLDLIFNSESVPIQNLYRLSDMTDNEAVEFDRLWAAATDDRKVEVARHLADLSEENSVVDFSPIFSFLLSESQSDVRVAALDGLWDCDDEDLIDPIIKLMEEDSSIEVKAAAAKSLAHFLLMAEWGQVPGRKTENIFNALRKQYEDPESSILVKGAALEAMGPLSHPRVSIYIEESYEGSIPGLQRSALFAMGNSADPKWLPILMDELESPYADMRAEAARAVGFIGSTDAVSLLSELPFEEDRDVALTAVTALAQVGGERANRVLEQLLEDSSMEHLHEAIELGLEESSWMEGELQLYPWLDEDPEDIPGLSDNPV